MNEEDQNPQTRQRKRNTQRHGQMRHKRIVHAVTNGPEHKQAVEKCSDKGAKHHLIGVVTHEVSQQPRPELRRRQ